MSVGTMLGGSVVTYHNVPTIKSHYPLITWSCEIAMQTTTMHMDTKLGRLMIYLDRISAIKLPNPLALWCVLRLTTAHGT